MAKNDLTRRENAEPSDELIRRVRGEFLEMPGLRVTPAEARRLWGLDDASCSALLETEFLFQTRDGAYIALPTDRR